MAEAKYKPLSFSTTIRNPERIPDFLNCLLPYENKILTSNVIHEVICSIISQKLYRPNAILKNETWKNIYFSNEESFTRYDIEQIIDQSPQQHKEKGFEKGWDSRFETWYQLPKELGFVYYNMNEPILISESGHMLIDSSFNDAYDSKSIADVFANSFAKYQTNNPFRKTLNNNIPLVLLLKVLKLLKEDDNNNKGIFRQEISLFLCYPDYNAEELFTLIKDIRNHYGFSYSEEFIYDKCLELLHAEEKDKKYYKLSKICHESVDDYIRKMRMTGLLSLRGNGRFLDYNNFEIEKINYILRTYPDIKSFSNEKDYYDYVGEIDKNIIETKTYIPETAVDLRKNTIIKFANEYDKTKILGELELLSGNSESKDELFRFIPKPARLEFLTSIAIKQNCKDIVVEPQYSFDDEGLPTSTAPGGIADIVCHDFRGQELIEVTLMRGRSEQCNNEIIPIQRHLLKAKETNENTFSIFIAPIVHDDAKEMADWYKYKKNIDILTFDILQFIDVLKATDFLGDLIDSV